MRPPTDGCRYPCTEKDPQCAPMKVHAGNRCACPPLRRPHCVDVVHHEWTGNQDREDALVLRCVDCGAHVCRTCGEEFQPGRPWQSFCSRKCNRAWHRNEQRYAIEQEKQRARAAAAAAKAARPKRKRAPRVEVSGAAFMKQLENLARMWGVDPAEAVRRAVDRAELEGWYNGAAAAARGDRDKLRAIQ